MALQAVEIGRANPEDLDRAIETINATSVSTPDRSMIDAMMVIIGEACAQMGIDKKSREEVIESLCARGLKRTAAERAGSRRLKAH